MSSKFITNFLNRPFKTLGPLNFINDRLSHKMPFFYNPLPNKKFLDWSKLKAFADDKINET